MVAPPELVLAIDIGATKLAAGLVTGSGRILDHRRVPTPATDAGELWAALIGLLGAVLGGHPTARPTVCGVGCGGPMAPGGHHVSPLNIPAWRRYPLRDRLAAHTGLPTYVDNDAKALALGEGWLGAAAGVRDFVALVVSSGVGGGIVLDGRLLQGASANAGHIGHVIVEPDGPLCGCGARGCLEALASGPSIQRLTGLPPADADLALRTRVGGLVGLAVADVANLLDLRLAVVGGSVALGFGGPFFDAAQAALDAAARLEFSAGARIVPVGLGADAPLVGAAAVALRGLGAHPSIG